MYNPQVLIIRIVFKAGQLKTQMKLISMFEIIIFLKYLQSI